MACLDEECTVLHLPELENLSSQGFCKQSSPWSGLSTKHPLMAKTNPKVQVWVAVQALTLVWISWGLDHAISFLSVSTSGNPGVNDGCLAKSTEPHHHVWERASRPHKIRLEINLHRALCSCNITSSLWIIYTTYQTSSWGRGWLQGDSRTTRVMESGVKFTATTGPAWIMVLSEGAGYRHWSLEVQNVPGAPPPP